MPDAGAVTDQEVATEAAWFRLYVVRRCWIECAAEDAGLRLGEFEADAILYSGGPPLLPERPIPALRSVPPRPAMTTRAAAQDWLKDLGKWASEAKTFVGDGETVPGVRRDLERVWTERARWAWCHYARQETWAVLARRDPRIVRDENGWRHVKRHATEALRAGQLAPDPTTTFTRLRELLSAYAATAGD